MEEKTQKQHLRLNKLPRMFMIIAIQKKNPLYAWSYSSSTRSFIVNNLGTIYSTYDVRSSNVLDRLIRQVHDMKKTDPSSQAAKLHLVAKRKQKLQEVLISGFHRTRIGGYFPTRKHLNANTEIKIIRISSKNSPYYLVKCDVNDKSRKTGFYFQLIERKTLIEEYSKMGLSADDAYSHHMQILSYVLSYVRDIKELHS